MITIVFWPMGVLAKKLIAHYKVLGTFAIYYRQPAQPLEALLDKIKTYSKLAELAISRSLGAEEISRLAFYDSLTGLANRRLLIEHLLQAIAASQRSHKFAGLMFIDLDNFKPVNDRYGHKTGDALLIEMAKRLQQSIRAADTVARFGGDEFIVLVRDIDEDVERAKQPMQTLADKIYQRIQQPFTLAGENVYQSSCSIGLVLFHGNANSDEILSQADSAMYIAKNQQSKSHWYQGD